MKGYKHPFSQTKNSGLNIKSLCLILLFLCAFSQIVFCQEDNMFYNNLNFKHISSKEGLSQRSVITILQDKQGFLWFGTRYGLNKYDGSTFKNYNYNSEDQNSLTHNWITCLTQDDQGQILIGTRRGLNVLNTKNDNFIRVKTDPDREKYYTESIRDLVSIDSSHVLIATENGLDKFNTRTGKISKTTDAISKKLSSTNITSLIEDKNDALWICTAKKIDFFDKDSKALKSFDYPEHGAPDMVKNYTTKLFEDKDGNIWLGYFGGLAFFNRVTKTFEDYKLNSKKAINSPVRNICQDREGVFWVGSYSGLHRINIDNKSIDTFKHNVNDSKTLSQNSIYSIIEDAKGDLWIGTWAGGINYLDRNSNNFLTFTVGPNHKHLNYKVVSSIVENETGDLWIGTEGGGLNFYDSKNRQFTYYTHDPKNINSLNTNNVKDIIKSRDGNLWVGTHEGGLHFIDLNNRPMKFKHFVNIQGNINSLNDNKVTALEEDSNSNIWIGTNEGGVNFYDTHLKKFSTIDDPNNILGKSIFTILKSSNEKTLFVGGQYGLASIDISSKKLQKIDFRDKPQGNFSVNEVISIYAASDNNLWIGTEGDGLYNYNLRTKESKSYGLNEGLPNEIIYGILPDDKNNIWVSSNKGISRLNLDSKQIKNFDETDGLQGNEFNYGACLKTRTGKLIFGGTSGLTIFDPNNIIEVDSYIPPIQITGFKVRNKPFIKKVDSIEELQLAHNQNDFSFDFVALGYAHPNKNQYAYKLEGFDGDWNYIGNKRTATYTNINPGKYTFLVKTASADGSWSKDVKKVHLFIKSPLWKNWWAYLGYVLIFIILTLTIRKYSLLRIKDRRQLKQERLDREKIEEINRLKLQLFTNISHDFRTPLTLILGPLKRLIDKNEGNGSIQKQLAGMYRNATILLQLINQLLDFRKSEAGKLKLSASKRNIVPFLENIKLSFEELALERNIDYLFKSDKNQYDIWFDKIEMKKVILNILSNAFKFTPKEGQISLSISNVKSNTSDSNKLKIVIQDNGKGIREQDIPHIFDRYFQLGQHHELRSGTGVGLALAKDIVLLHNGEIFVKSEEGQGTQFTILLPKGHSHLSENQMIPHENNLESEMSHFPQYDASSVVNIGWTNVDETSEVFINDTLSSILIVEDNIEVRSFIKDIFEGMYNVFEAKNGYEAISIAQSKSIDLIISDIMMPEMDGLKFCSEIKTDITTSHIPVVLLTARTSTKTKQQGYNKGADAYITKPFDADLLKMQVQNLINSRKKLIEKFKKNIILEPSELKLESPDEILLNKLLKVVEDNLSESTFMASTLIEKMHMSQSVLYRKLKVLTGQSISEFIRTIRIKRASQLLLQTNLSIAEIAYEVGFNDLKYFRRCFKKAFEQTPSQYRKSQLQNIDSQK